MLRRLGPIAMLVGIASLTAVACGGGNGEEAAGAAPAAASAPAAGPSDAESAATATAEAVTQGAVRSGVTGTQDGATQFALYVVGGGGTTGQKSNTYGAVPFNWEISEMSFKVGETVTFTLIPTADKKWSHTFTSTGLGIRENISFGNSVTVTHTFDTPGQFKFVCENHAGEGMAGIITVN